MTKERRLGRGLAALLGEPLENSPATQPALPDRVPTGPRLHDASVPETTRGADMGGNDASHRSDDGQASDGVQMVLLDVHEIDENPFQPRREFGKTEIASLAESLKAHDMLQPVLVRRVGDRWQLISGERRLRAAIQAGWSHVPARVREADDRLVAELAIVENLQRKDLNSIEKALSFQRYLREHQCKQDDLASRLKIDRSTIANLLRLLELPEPVQEALRSGAISAGHARALLPLGEERRQIEFCNRIRGEGLSVRETERWVQETIKTEDSEPLAVVDGSPKKKRRTQSQQIATLEQELRVALGTRVEIRQGSRGRGRIVIHFNSYDEYERIRRHLAGEESKDLRIQVG